MSKLKENAVRPSPGLADLTETLKAGCATMAPPSSSKRSSGSGEFTEIFPLSSFNIWGHIDFSICSLNCFKAIHEMLRQEDRFPC